MKLVKIEVENFRSLKNIVIDLEDDLSIIVGKNNVGKTSLLLVMERFLGSGSSGFDFDDFNKDFQQNIAGLIENRNDEEKDSIFPGIRMRLFIKYSDDDDLGIVGHKVMMDLDSENNVIVLDYGYILPSESLETLRRDYGAYRDKRGEKAADDEVFRFLRDMHRRYFKVTRRSLYYDIKTHKVDETVFVDLIKENIRLDDVIAFRRIAARRSVSNRDTDRTLSGMSSKIYAAMPPQDGSDGFLDTFTQTLRDVDKSLNDVYADIFGDVIGEVLQFGGVREGETKLEIRSTLQQRELLADNTTVMYSQGDNAPMLPESFNGLGYLNLIHIIFEIRILLDELKRSNKTKPADINILFIEEPEAHTHPQMQAVFINNIKRLVTNWTRDASGVSHNLQIILSTHSAHIVAESDFDDIKYFRKNGGLTEVRPLRGLREIYEKQGRDKYFSFLKQYLTLQRSQIFFADKAILVEGETERILLPAMMLKIDQADAEEAYSAGKIAPLPLLSQNISIIEVGAHAQIYEIFLDFIGVKTLIITDLDPGKPKPRLKKDGTQALSKKTREPVIDYVACPVADGTQTNNHALRFFFNGEKALDFYLRRLVEEKTLSKTENGWTVDSKGHFMCVYQTKEYNDEGTLYCGSSFEDAFFHVNLKFMEACYKVSTDTGTNIGNNSEEEDLDDNLPDLKKGVETSLKKAALRQFLEDKDPYEMASKGINKKPAFAIEILLNSKTEDTNIENTEHISRDFVRKFCNWNTPAYILGGLRWIKKG